MTNPANDLIALTARLVAIIAQENELLHAMRPGLIAPLQEEKARLVQAYNRMTRALAGDPKLLAAIGAALKEELAGITRTFRDAVQANERAIKAARDANERLVQAVAAAAGKQRTPSFAYSATGAFAGPSRGSRSGPVSVVLDQQL